MNTKLKKTFYKYKFIFLLLLIPILFPFNLVIAKAHKLQVVDINGNPVTTALIRQRWYQYALGERGYVELNVDTDGQIKIPARIVKTNILSLMLGAMREIGATGIHASFSSHYAIRVYVKGHKTMMFYEGRGLESGVVVIK